jgi:hypothetical protein
LSLSFVWGQSLAWVSITSIQTHSQIHKRNPTRLASINQLIITHYFNIKWD